MAFTEQEEARLAAIESILSKIEIAIGNLMSKQQMRQLLLLRQEEIDTLKNKVASLESQISILQKNL